ncbi:MAG: hypothetical protein ACTS46_01760 [Candidatus Hodgkinia cicadicola]
MLIEKLRWLITEVRLGIAVRAAHGSLLGRRRPCEGEELVRRPPVEDFEDMESAVETSGSPRKRFSG